MKVKILEAWDKSYAGESLGATIGNFDGVHLGHRKLLELFLKDCAANGLKPVIFTFKPHPELYFDPGRSHLISDYKEKYKILEKLGFDHVVEIDFAKIKNLSGSEFAGEYLSGLQCDLKLLWIGHDFTFGKDRAKPELVFPENEAPRIERAKAYDFDGQVVSSSLVRSLLSKGDLERANALLGRPFSVSGVVGHGKKLGRQIGFPTMNIHVHYQSCVPAFGVYRVSCKIDGKTMPGVMNVGVNPSVSAENSIKWEAHLLDFEGDLYGKHVEAKFERFIRFEKKFDSVEALKAQIKKDILTAKERSS